MKTIIVLILMTLTFQVQAKFKDTNSKAGLPANTTQNVFETLVKVQSPSVKFKAPMEITVEDIVCSLGSGRPYTPKCVAAFKDNDKVTNKTIGNSEELFNSLMALNAISLDEVMIGATVYKTKKLSCAYNLDSYPYYKCTSDVLVRF